MTTSPEMKAAQWRIRCYLMHQALRGAALSDVILHCVCYTWLCASTRTHRFSSAHSVHVQNYKTRFEQLLYIYTHVYIHKIYLFFVCIYDLLNTVLCDKYLTVQRAAAAFNVITHWCGRRCGKLHTLQSMVPSPGGKPCTPYLHVQRWRRSGSSHQ